MTPSPGSSTLRSRGWTRRPGSSSGTRSSRATRSRRRSSGPGGTFRAPRSRPVRRLAPSTHRQRMSRPRAEPATAPDRGRAQRHRLPPRRPTMPAPSPTASSSTRRSSALTRVIVRSSRCTTCWEFSLPDVAASLGVPLGTAKSRLRRALAAMRRSTTVEPEPAPSRSPEGRSHDRGQPLERELVAMLEDLYLGPSPTTDTEVVAVAVARGQRPPEPSQEGRPMATSPLSPRAAPRAAGPSMGVGAHRHRTHPGRRHAHRRLDAREASRSRSDWPVISPHHLCSVRQHVHGRSHDQCHDEGRSFPNPGRSAGASLLARWHPHRVPAGHPRETAARRTTSVSSPRTVEAGGHHANPDPGRPEPLPVGAGLSTLLVRRHDDSAIWLYDVSAAAPPRKVATNAQPVLPPVPAADRFRIPGLATGKDVVTDTYRLSSASKTGRERVLAEGNEKRGFRRRPLVA